MASASVSGLVSGLDTSTIISQLMKVEAQTQTNLKAKLSTEQSTVKSLQDLNSAFAALATSSAALAKASAWNPVTVTATVAGTTSTAVSATAGPNAVSGALSFTLGQTALSHRLTFATSAALAAPVTNGPHLVRLDRLDGTTQDIDTGDGSLGGLISALNASGTGVKASTVRLDDGTLRLQVTSSTTGAASDFTLTNTDGSDLLGGATVRAGADAEITLGTDVVHSATNTFTDVANGLSITVSPTIAAGTVVDLEVSQDTAGMTRTIKGLVESVNAALTKIDSLTAYNSATKSAGPLAGDASVRALRNSVLSTVYPTDGRSLADVGIQLDRFGKLTFDADTFSRAYTADPSAVAGRFVTAGGTAGADGFAARVQAVTTSASDSIDGTITASINGRSTTIRRMQDSIDSWDTRLALRQSTLTKQFAAMESALQQMNSQSSWLSSQLGSLSSS